MKLEHEIAALTQGHHRTFDEGWDCAADGQDWPCQTIKLAAVARRLKRVLEYYADPSNYEDQDNSCTDECCDGPWPSVPVVDQDGGATARAALGVDDA